MRANELYKTMNTFGKPVSEQTEEFMKLLKSNSITPQYFNDAPKEWWQHKIETGEIKYL